MHPWEPGTLQCSSNSYSLKKFIFLSTKFYKLQDVLYSFTSLVGMPSINFLYSKETLSMINKTNYYHLLLVIILIFLLYLVKLNYLIAAAISIIKSIKLQKPQFLLLLRELNLNNSAQLSMMKVMSGNLANNALYDFIANLFTLGRSRCCWKSSIKSSPPVLYPTRMWPTFVIFLVQL
jgi:hypothetical protein